MWLRNCCVYRYVVYVVMASIQFTECVMFCSAMTSLYVTDILSVFCVFRWKFPRSVAVHYFAFSLLAVTNA